MAEKKVLQLPLIQTSYPGVQMEQSLDVVQTQDGVIFAIAERGPIQRRTLVTISHENALALAKFLAGITPINQ